MASPYPGQVDSFPVFVDYSEYMTAADMNNADNAIVAIENTIGAGAGNVAANPLYSPTFNQSFATVASRLVNLETVAQNAQIVASGSLPSGLVMQFAGAAAPSGWFLCNGQAVSRSTYSALFLILGTVWGVGDGSTTFNIPDLRGRTVMGVGAVGTNQQPTIPLGSTDGQATYTMTQAELPAVPSTGTVAITEPNAGLGHFHLLPGSVQYVATAATPNFYAVENAAHPGFLAGGDQGVTFSNAPYAVSGVTAAFTGGNLGSGAPVPNNNLVPYAGMNYIVKY